MKDLSLYIHWPFCLSKCPYCDFNSHVFFKIDHSKWLGAYEREIEYFAFFLRDKNIKSIFFGGGTPSLMDPYIVYGIINKLFKISNFSSDIEITLEANPSSFETKKFLDFKIIGVNRVSIGVQSLVENDLRFLGRMHDKKQIINALEEANSLFTRVSFDMIYGRPKQSLEDWRLELSDAMTMASGHISLYQLVVEKGTKFYKLLNNGSLILPDPDLLADQYDWTNEYLKSYGYNRYEISNYAKEGEECKHNLSYWEYKDYLGIGPGAHSRISLNHRVYSMQMYSQPEQWLASINNLGHAIQKAEFLDKKQIIYEILMMGLRLKNGIKISSIENRIGKKLMDILDMSIIDSLQKLGLINNDITDRFSLTDKGLVLHNYILSKLLETTYKMNY